MMRSGLIRKKNDYFLNNPKSKSGCDYTDDGLYNFMKLINFSRWKSWEKREVLDGLDYSGVYALAISSKNLSNKLFSLTDEIVYFGMTNSGNGLRGRLNQFHNTIIGKIGHGGAERFLFKYKNYDVLKKNLFVSVNFVKCDVNSSKPGDLCRMGEVVNFEYICFAEYAKKFGRLPEFNDKKLSPKRKKNNLKLS